MKAALCTRHGGPDTVALSEIDVPPVGDGQVRTRIHAAAVNFPDVLVVANSYQIKVATPLIPGSEFAGEVIEVADDVDRFAVGDHVFGSTMVGAFAEQIVLAANA